MSEISRDSAGVIVPPPLIPASVLLLGLVLSALLPLGLLGHIPLTLKVLLGTISFVGGAAMVVDSNYVYRHIGTPAALSRPTLALATTGVFRWTRNPMYVGGSLALAGIAIGFALDWVLALLILSLPLMHYGIVLREEQYLERKFGDEYRRYAEKVSRYGWFLKRAHHRDSAGISYRGKPET
jgi:protein-S-isoprenylcysteine O-methyltransferase Ste14